MTYWAIRFYCRQLPKAPFEGLPKQLKGFWRQMLAQGDKGVKDYFDKGIRQGVIMGLAVKGNFDGVTSCTDVKPFRGEFFFDWQFSNEDDYKQQLEAMKASASVAAEKLYSIRHVARGKQE